MKQMQYLVLLVLILIGCSTVSSQTINIPRDQKIEVVTTLQSYPSVLLELDLTEELLKQCKELNEVYFKQLSLREEQLLNQQDQIRNLEAQKTLFDRQLKKEKSKNFILGGSGVLLLVLSLLFR